MFSQLKNRIKEETGNDVDLIPSIVNHSKLNKDKNSHHGSTTSLGSFTIDGNREDPISGSSTDVKLADGKVLTQKEFKKLEAKEDEWRKKLQKKEEEFTTKLKKVEDMWKKKLEDKEREMKKELGKKETERKSWEDERNELLIKVQKLSEEKRLETKKVEEYKKMVCQYQEDIDQVQGFQTQEMAKIKHLLLVKEQELAEKDKAIKESDVLMKSYKAEITRLRAFEQQYENAQDDLETLRHNFDLEKAQLTSKLAEKEEDVRHLKDKVALLEERANSGPIAEMTVDERVQKLLGERALFERRLEEAHLHLSQIKSSWSGKIESLETQLGRLCRQASEESAEKRQAELQRDLLQVKLTEVEEELEKVKAKSEMKNGRIEKLTLEKSSLEDEIKKIKVKREEDVRSLHEEIKSVTENAFNVEEKLEEKSKEATEKEETIKRLESRLESEEKAKILLESRVRALDEAFESEKNLSREMKSLLEKERLEKDAMMMRNAEVSQEVELARQDVRNQRMEVADLHARIAALETELLDKQKDFERVGVEKQELESKVNEFEKIQKEFSLNAEKDLKAKIIQLENELFEKNKNVKVLQQRLSDIKKTLQRELKVPSTAIDPGGSDPDGFLPVSYATNPPFGSSPAPLQPSSHHNSISRPRGEEKETYDDANDDVNFKYLKHVLIKFLTSRECEAQHLTRAVATLLRFSAEEEKLLKETLEWKMSWFGTRPNLGNGQTAKTIPPS